MITTRTAWLILLGVGILLGAAAWIVVLDGRLDRERQRSADAALAEANAIAERDRTRALADEQLAAARRVYADSVAAVTRLVVQTVQRNDDLDRALRQDRRALAEITAVVKRLDARGTASAPATDDAAGVRRASFDVRDEPYTARADVALAPPGSPPSASTIALTVALDSARLRLRLGCETANARGIRPARATLVSPPWLSATLERVEQDPGVCPDITEDVTAPGWLERLVGKDRFAWGPTLFAGRTWAGEWASGYGVAGIIKLGGIP